MFFQATPEQLRLAQIINGSIRDEDMETQRSVEKVCIKLQVFLHAIFPNSAFLLQELHLED